MVKISRTLHLLRNKTYSCQYFRKLEKVTTVRLNTNVQYIQRRAFTTKGNEIKITRVIQTGKINEAGVYGRAFNNMQWISSQAIIKVRMVLSCASRHVLISYP